MLDLLVMLFFFLDAVFIHLVLCRKHTGEGLLLKPFIGVALVNLCLMGGCFWFFDHYFSSDPVSFWNVRLYASATLIYLLLIPTYLVFYFSTQQMSPTKKILLLLAQNKSMTQDDLLPHFSDEEFVLPRIKELIAIGCMVEHGGWYVLSPTGIQMANVYKMYQSVLGRKMGG